jgi:hypothetical protein
MLLRRADIPVLDVIERQIGLNAQDPQPPYLALWARMRSFNRDTLTQLLYDRAVVRSTLMRSTQFMMRGPDFLALRPLLAPVLRRVQKGAFGRATSEVDLDELVALTRMHLADGQLTRPELGRLLAKRWPSVEGNALGWSAQYLVAMIHPPPSGTWGTGGATPFVLGESWLDGPLSTDPSPDELIRRYLAAYGPASVKDIQAWSGLTRLREPVDSLDLRTFHDENGVVLYDLPDAPLPDPDTPAPVRLLPYFDNLVLSHFDRSRVMTDEIRKLICIGAMTKPTLLVDGMVCGTWTIEPDRLARQNRVSSHSAARPWPSTGRSPRRGSCRSWDR